MRQRTFGLVVVAAVALAACGGGATPSARSAVSVSPSPVVASPGAATQAPAGHAQRNDGPLAIPLRIPTAADTTYRTSNFAVPLRFRTHAMPYPFTAEVDSPTYFEMDSGESGAVLFVSPRQVYGSGTSHLVPAPHDIAAWIGSYPNVDVTDRGPATIAGVTGERLDLRVTSIPKSDSKSCDGGPCIPLFPVGGGHAYGLGKGIVFQWTVLTVHGHALVISVEGPKNGFGSLSDNARSLLKTLHIS